MKNVKNISKKKFWGVAYHFKYFKLHYVLTTPCFDIML